MKKIVSILVSLLIFLGISYSTAMAREKEIPFKESIIKNKYLVIYKNKAAGEKKVLARGKIEKIHKHIPVATVEMLPDKVKELENDPDVLLIEPDGLVQIEEAYPWNVIKINADIAQSNSITGQGIKIAVLDTGVDMLHEDLSIAGGVSVIDEVYYSSVAEAVYDGNGHGTHVAGIIDAQVNGNGIIGVSPGAQIYAVKVLDENGLGTYSQVIASIDWAIENNMNIINMSFGGSQPSVALEQAMQRARDNGILLVAAAGNTCNQGVLYPAKYSSVIAVGAVDQNNQRAEFSAIGPELELVAPGVGIESTLPGNNYGLKSGTSFAAPHVTGAAALIWSSQPSLTNNQVRDSLLQKAHPLGNTVEYGNGLVDYSGEYGELDPNDIEPVNEDIIKLNNCIHEDLDTARIVATGLLSSEDFSTKDYVIKVLGEIGEMDDLPGLGYVIDNDPQSSVVSQVYVSMAKISMRGYEEEDKKLSVLESMLNSQYSLAVDYAVYQLGCMDSEAARTLAGQALPVVTDPNSHSVLEAVYMNASGAVDYSVLSYPRDSLEGLVDILSYDRQGDNQRITAGQSATVSCKLYEYHSQIQIKVYKDGNKNDIYGWTVRYMQPANSSIIYTWQTQSTTPAGTYTIWYHYPDNGTNLYDDYFTIYVQSALPPEPYDQYEPNNYLSEATFMQVGNSYTAYIGRSGDNDYYRFTPSQSGTLSFQMTGPNVDFDVKLLNSSGSSLTGSAKTGTSNESFTYSVTAGSTYYLRIYGYGGAYSSIPYTFTTSLQPSYYDIYEPNNTMSTATNIVLGRSYTAYIDYSGDKDYYCFVPGVTGSLYFNMCGPTGCDYDVDLLNGNGQTITYSRKSGSNESFNYVVAAGSTYYLKIYGHGTSYDRSRSYTFATSLSTSATMSVTSLTVPAKVNPGKAFTVEAKVKNTSGLAANGVKAEITLPAGLSLKSGTTQNNLGQMAGGTEQVTTWQVIANVAAPAVKTVSVKAWADNADHSLLQSIDVNIVAEALTGKDAVEKITKYFPEEIKGEYGKGYVYCPVNTANGAYVLAKSLISVNGAQPLDFMAHYNSLLLHESTLGMGWGHNYETRAEVLENGDVIIRHDNSRENTFTNNSGNYVPADQANKFDTLVKNPDGTYTFTKQDQTVYIFSAEGKLDRVNNGHGQSLNMSYDGSGRLAIITEPISGQTLQITYNSNGLIDKVADRTGRKVSFSYNTKRNLTGITDTNGKKTSYTYTTDGRLYQIKNPDGITQITNSFDDQARVVQQDDAVTGNQPGRFSYDETSQPGKVITTVTDRNGQTKVYTYDDKYNLLSIRDENGNTVNYTYDQNGKCISETDAASRTTSYTYDARGNLLTVTDPAGRVTTMTYDERNNLLSVRNAAGKQFTNEYDINNNLTRITDPLGNVTTYNYDSNGLLQSAGKTGLGTITYSYQNGLLHTATDPEGYTTTCSYDGTGRLTGITNGAGKTTQMEYDNEGNLLKITDPLNNITTFTYDSRGNKLTAKDPRGNTTRFSYNGNNKLISVTDALNKITKYEYDGEDRLKKVTDARGNSTTLNYDPKGRLISTTDPLGNTTTYAYDVVDRLVSQLDAMFRQVLFISYDSVNNPVTITDALNRTVSNQYDVLSRLTRITDPMGRATQFQYDDLNRLTLTTDALNGQARQTFTGFGSIASLTDPNNNQATYSYDNAGRLISSTSAGSTTSYQYNSRNLVSQSTNGRGQVTNYQYDDAGRLTSFTDPAGTVSITYDANGNVLTVTDTGGTTTREYDALNRVKKYTDSKGNIIQYAYDAVGNLVTLTYPGGKQVKYEYDAANRLTKVTDWSNRVTKYEYDANSRLVKETRPNGTVLTKSYDAAGQLLQQKDVSSSGNIIAQYDFTYDAAGNITVEQEAGTTTPVAVDATNMTYGPGNRLATFNGQTVSYDADGNMTSGPLAGQIGNYSYDARNRLLSAGSLSYQYDAENNRSSVTDSVYNTQTSFVINPNASLSQVLIKTDGQGNKTYYVYGLGLIGQEEPGGIYETYHYDLRGSTVAMADNNGTVTDWFRYESYGRMINHTGSTSTPFLYNGKYGVMADGNGLYYMRARYYNPEIRRFINQDPIVGSADDTLSLNRFAYVKGSPVSYIDPLGLWTDYVHSGLTYEWATEFGFSASEAKCIADANNNIDWGALSNPYFGDQSWHFDTNQTDSENFNNNLDPTSDSRWTHRQEKLASAIDLYKKGWWGEAYRELGRALHAVQDIDAHFKWLIIDTDIGKRRIHGTNDPSSQEWNSAYIDEKLNSIPGYGKWNPGFYDDTEWDWDYEKGKWVRGNNRLNWTHSKTIDLFRDFREGICSE